MAAILGSVGTARADGAADSTIIASKGYVDAYAQKQSDRVQQVYSTYTADANNTEAKKKADYPSMYTLEQAITGVTANQAQSNWTETDTNSPAYIRNKFADGTQTGTGVVKTVTQSGGTVTASAGTVDTAEITDGAVTYAKVNSAAKTEAQDLSVAGATLTRWDPSAASGTAGYAADDKFPTVKAVAQQIADVAANQAQSNWNETDTTSPAYIQNKPTIPVVDQTYNAASANAQSGVAVASAISGKEDSSNKKNATSAAEWNTLTAAATKSTDYTTVQAVENALSTVTGDYEQNNVVTSANPNKATKVTAVQKGTFYMDGADIANRRANVGINDVKAYVTQALATGGPGMKWGVEGLTGTEASKMDDYIPTVAAVEARFKAQDRHNNDTYLDGNNITASNVHSIVTYDSDGLVTGGINLNDTLNNINVANGGSTGGNACSAANPCVLSYIGGNTYKWTQMDTEGLNAVADQASGS